MAAPDRSEYRDVAIVTAVFSLLPTILTFSVLEGIGEGIHVENPELKALGVSAITYPLWFLVVARSLGLSLTIRNEEK